MKISRPLLLSVVIGLFLAVPLIRVLVVKATANQPPVTSPDSYSAHKTLHVNAPGPLGNDNDPEGNTPLHVQGFTGPTDLGGSIVLLNDGSFDYTAPLGPGPISDHVTYQSCDNLGACAPGVMNFTVTNAIPTAGNVTYTLHKTLDVEVPSGQVGGLLSNSSDGDGDPIQTDHTANSFIDIGQYGHLKVFVNGAFNARGNSPTNVTYTYAFRVCDDRGACTPDPSRGIATFNITNEAPVAVNDIFLVYDRIEPPTLPPGVKGGVLRNDSDPDGDDITVFNVGGAIPTANMGSIQFYPNGTFRYVAPSNFSGLDSATYTVTDDLGRHTDATVYFYVIGQDDDTGAVACNSRVGLPVNVTNGNMYLQQSDFRLPGVGPNIDVTRTYNSNGSQSSWLFGAGWSTIYDESITEIGPNIVRAVIGNGRAVYSGRIVGTTGTPYQSLSTDEFSTTVKNGNGTYTVTYKDGSIHQFNSAGRLTALIDRNNNQTVLTYDNGRLTKITDTFGRFITVSTNTAGQVTQLSDDTGVIATYVYYDTGVNLGLLNSVTYADGSQFIFSYVTAASRQRLATVTDALGKVVEHHEYDNSTGKALTSERQNGIDKYTLNFVSATETDVTDAEGRVTKYTHQKINARNLVTQIEGTCGCGGGSQIQQWDYDNRGNVIKKTNALNQITTYTFDPNGNVLTMTDLDGTRTFTYNGFSEVLTATDPMSGLTTLTYDTKGNLLTVKDALNYTTTLTVNSRGQITSFKDARTGSNNTTTFGYTNADLVTKTDPLGHQTTYTYWPRGRLRTVSDLVTQGGSTVTLTTQYEYDAVGRPKKMIYPDAAHNFVENFYDLAGRMTSTKDARGNSITYGYDDSESSYRLATVTVPVTDLLTQTTTFGYTPMSQMKFRIDALNHRTDYEYDDFSRLKKVIYPEASSGVGRLDEEYSYDALGRTTQHLDTANRATIYTYDDVGRIYEVKDALLGTTRYEYNQRHHLTKVTDALMQVYQFVPDALGQVRSVTRGGGTRSYDYDEVGNRKQRIDYNGAVTNYGYDQLSRLHTITYPEGTSSTYNYDEISRLVSAANQTGTVSFVYDNRSQVVSTTDVLGKTITYTYDANGNRKTMASGTSLSVSYDTYDKANRLRQLTDTGGRVFNFDYNAVDQIATVTRSSGLVSTYTYDGMNRLKGLTQATLPSHFDFSYSYDQAGNIQQIVSTADTRTYTYDQLNRLTDVSNSSGANETYRYDAVGNRTSSHLSSSYTLQSNNRVTATATATYGYDANGNMTSRTDAAGRWYFTWDGENRLVRVLKPGMRPVSARSINYLYDALGRRIERSSRLGGSQSYTYDGHDTVLDQNPDGTQTAYANGPGIDNKLSQVRDSNHGNYLQDHLGSTVAVTDTSGHDPSTIRYDSFGRPSNSFNSRFTYTGRESDPDTGLMYYRARWYDPQLGRFIGEDPIGFAGGDINLYAYVANNPVGYVDPDGMQRADRDRPGDMYPGMREPYRPNASGPATSANSQIDCTCSGNPVEVFVWQPTDNDIHGLAGHVSYGIDGQMYNWQGGGWATPVNASEYIRLNVQYRSANSYILDFGPDGNRKFASGIANAYVGQEPMFGFPNWPYNLFTNNCGSAVGRSAQGMGFPYDYHVSPAGQEAYINDHLGPYVIRRNHYAQEGRGNGIIDSVRGFFESLAGSIESLYGVPH